MRSIRHAFGGVVSLSLVACTTVDGERPGFLQTMQQVVGAASMVVGAKAGDTAFAQQGANMFQQGLGASAGGTATPAPVPSSTPGPTTVAQGGGHDLNAIGQRCSQIAESKYYLNQQNVLMQRAACISLCAHSVTGIQRYYDMYVENQKNANSLCSAGRVAPDCNRIDTGYCRYH